MEENPVEAKVIETPVDYYTRRVQELFDSRYDHQDVWVARGEVSSILDELKTNHNYKKLSIEHEMNCPSIHLAGGAGVPKFLEHMSVKTKDVSRHLFITDDPFDARLRDIGIGYTGSSERGKIKHWARIPSTVYFPEFPRGKDIERIVIETVRPSESKTTIAPYTWC